MFIIDCVKVLQQTLLPANTSRHFMLNRVRVGRTSPFLDQCRKMLIEFNYTYKGLMAIKKCKDNIKINWGVQVCRGLFLQLINNYFIWNNTRLVCRSRGIYTLCCCTVHHNLGMLQELTLINIFKWCAKYSLSDSLLNFMQIFVILEYY